MNPEMRTIGDQVYRKVSERQHITRSGRETTLSVWSTVCAACGCEFEATSPLHAKKFEPQRRCEAHRRPGVRA